MELEYSVRSSATGFTQNEFFLYININIKLPDLYKQNLDNTNKIVVRRKPLKKNLISIEKP